MKEHKNVIKLLEGSRVFLRPIEEDDLELFYRGLWDQEMRRLTGTKAVFSKIGLRKWYEGISQDNSRIDLLICLQDSCEVIGELSLNNIDYTNRNANVRIAITNKAYLGRGFGSEALALLLRYAFSIQNLHRICLDVFAYNERAIKAYEKLGFKVEGRMRDALFYDGEYHDSIIMGLLRSDFSPVE